MIGRGDAVPFARRPPLRVILVGANPRGRGGEWAKTLAQCPDLATLVGVCDNDHATRDAFPDNLALGEGTSLPSGWRELPRAATVSELLSRVDADAAILAVPHLAYGSVRPECLRAGVGVLHEKPLACSLAEILQVQRQLTDHPVPLVVGVQRRSHPSYVELRRRLREATAETLAVHMALGLSESQAENGWRSDLRRAGGGSLIDIGYHAIDLVHFLLDAPLRLIACDLWRKGRPAREGELETRATLVGRCGTTWVRVTIDRCGTKAEHVEARAGERTLRADRVGLFDDGKIVIECPRAWDDADRSRLAELAEACSLPAAPVSLWDHLAVLQVIEEAYRRKPPSASFRAEESV